MAATILDGKTVAMTIRTEIAQRVAEFRTKTGVQPCLATVLVGDDPASQVYVRNKGIACEKAGMRGLHVELSATTLQSELMAKIDELNGDPTVHGILCQLPLPKGLDETAVLQSIRPSKDVDCFHPENVGLMVQNHPRFLPCTPAGVQQLLIRSGIETRGAHVVVVGRSDIVGKPMAMMMLQKMVGNVNGADSTVTVVHSRTRNLAELTRMADILIVAIGKAKFVTAEMVRPGAVVVDVGINRVEPPAGSELGTKAKLCGDVDFDAVKEIASAITPVPGGVGPLTIAMLLENTMRAAVGG